jgi:glycosyltransferase involved in cell wall biosynthesis
VNQKEAELVLAAADDDAIKSFKHRLDRYSRDQEIITFPTRIDDRIFHPGSRRVARNDLSLSQDATLIVTTGRITEAKGWRLLLDAFKLFSATSSESLLIFVGDGEDKSKLIDYARNLGVETRVRVTGRVAPPIVASYLRAANVFVLGSVAEGWSTSLVESLASHLPIVTTYVSSASSIVRDGINGFVVHGRDPYKFAGSISNTLGLDVPVLEMYCKNEVQKYTLARLKTDLENLWPEVVN